MFIKLSKDFIHNCIKDFLVLVRFFYKKDNLINQKSFKQILAIRKDNLGDLILTLPGMKALKANFPQSKLVLLINSKNYDLVKDFDWIDDIILYDSSKKWSIKQMFQLYKKIRKLNPDLSIDFEYGDTLEITLLNFLLRVPVRIGYDVGQHGILFTHSVKPDKKPLYELDYVFNLLKIFNFKNINKDFIKLPTEYINSSNISKIFKQTDKLKIYMSPFVSNVNKLKEWPKERFAELADRLTNDLNVEILISSQKDDLVEIEKIISLMKTKPINCGTTSFDDWISVINNSDLVITNNTGTMHVAASLFKPTIIINGPSSIIRWNPKDTKLHTTITKNLPCSFFDCNYCWRGDNACINWITVQEVFNIVKNKIEEIKCNKKSH